MMLVLRKTMEAAVEAQREIGANAVLQLARSYGDALNRVTALQKQMAAWVLNEPRNITPEQMAQMFYSQNDTWQAKFFNCMQDEVRAIHDAMPPAHPGGWPTPHAGVPAGEGQWYHIAKHLDDSGFETLEAMFVHARDCRARCSTCNGTGVVDERLGGLGTSEPAAPCPDCTGAA